MVKFKYPIKNISLSTGCKIPWYYGYAYSDYYRDLENWYIIPFHWIFKFFNWFSFKWHRMRFKINKEDHFYGLGYKEGYYNGRNERIDLLTDAIKDKLIKEIINDRRKEKTT